MVGVVGVVWDSVGERRRSMVEHRNCRNYIFATNFNSRRRHMEKFQNKLEPKMNEFEST